MVEELRTVRDPTYDPYSPLGILGETGALLRLRDSPTCPVGTVHGTSPQSLGRPRSVFQERSGRAPAEYNLAVSLPSKPFLTETEHFILYRLNRCCSQVLLTLRPTFCLFWGASRSETNHRSPHTGRGPEVK